MENNPKTAAQNAAKRITLCQLLRGDDEVGFRAGGDGYGEALIMRKPNGGLYEIDAAKSERRMYIMDKIRDTLYAIVGKLDDC